MRELSAPLAGWRATRRTADRVGVAVAASAVIATVAAAWFMVNFVGPRGPLVLLWLPALASLAITAVSCWRVTRAADLPPATRNFWRHMALAAVLVGIAYALQTADAVRGVDNSAQGGPVPLAVNACAILVVLLALYRLPMGPLDQGERLRVGLDAGTVMLATAVFMWHYQTRPLLQAQIEDRSLLVGSLFATVIALVAVFAVAKVVLVGRVCLNIGSLWLLALGMVTGALGSVPQRFLLDKPHLVCAQAVIPVVMLCATAAAERQRSAGAAPPTRRRQGTRRRLSVLPYLAVAAVDALLLASTWGEAGDEGVVAVVAVGLTAVVVVRQITVFRDNDRLLSRLDYSATHDALTGLANRTLFGERLRAALALPDRRVSLALVDLDDFKLINDTLGHGVGDALLVALAERLSGGVRATDTVARLGGDEFVVLLDDIDPAGAQDVVDKLTGALSAPITAEDHELLVNISTGIADGGAGDDANELLRRADIAMYVAKEQTGSSYARFVADMDGRFPDPASLGAELQNAIQRDEMFLLYQPIVTLDGQRPTGVEALMRWAHPTRGTLSPAEFIPVAERTGLIVPLGRWAIHQACRQFTAWSTSHAERAPKSVNVNVSARQLHEPGFADEVIEVLARTGMAPDRLILEITETTAVRLGAGVGNIHALRRIGVRIALDDFGTGQSSLSLLHEFPVDQLKLDRSFTQADTATRSDTMAAAVIQLARVLGLHVVAEGVETRQQANRLRELGYPAAQGYLFAKPMPAAAIDAALTVSATKQAA